MLNSFTAQEGKTCNAQQGETPLSTVIRDWLEEQKITSPLKTHGSNYHILVTAEYAVRQDRKGEYEWKLSAITAYRDSGGPCCCFWRQAACTFAIWSGRFMRSAPASWWRSRLRCKPIWTTRWRTWGLAISGPIWSRRIPSAAISSATAWSITASPALFAQSKKAAEQALQISEAANKAKSAFLGNASHDIRAPMNAILRPQAKAKDQTFDIFVTPLKYELLLGDKLRLNQILINLLSSSVKCTPAGSRIEMRVEELPQVMKTYSRVRFTVNGKRHGHGHHQEPGGPDGRRLHQGDEQAQ